MGAPDPATMDRKLGRLRQFLRDLGAYARLDPAARRREHYAIERLLQLLCEASADIALQHLKARGLTLPASYREIFSALAAEGALPPDMARDLIAACGMRNVLTHLYDNVDMDRVLAAVDPALDLYQAFLDWALARPPQ